MWSGTCLEETRGVENWDAAAYREERTKRSSRTCWVKFCRQVADRLKTLSFWRDGGKTANEHWNHCRQAKGGRELAASSRRIDVGIKRPECRNDYPSYPQISCISLDKYTFPNLPQIHYVRPEKYKTLIVTDRYGVRRIEESKKKRLHCNVITTGF